MKGILARLVTWKRSWRFEGLLVILVVSLGLMPFLDDHFFTPLIASFLLISTVSAASDGRAYNRIGWTLALFSLTALWAAEINGSVILVLASGYSDIAFYLIMTTAILGYVFRATRVTRDVLAGAICAYLLMGLGWSNIFVVLENHVPGSFSSGALASAATGGLEGVHQQQGHFTYLSLVTLSTLGYGDITPVTQPARMWAALEAIIGQLFIGVLIARLVGQQIKPRTDRT
jgi:hypothetical protein